MALDTIIHLKDVSVYQKENLVLTNVSFDIGKGEFVYLIGKTGSGKSSLMKVLYADLPMRDGEAIIAERSLQNIRPKHIPELRRNIGIIFQDFQLLHDRNVHDNLMFVMKATGWKDKNEMENRLQDVLNWVGLGTKGFKMPHQLAGGEQQRVVIARALINDPEIILADEPTGNLDPETSRDIMNLIFKLRDSGRAIIMATHDYSLLDDFPARVLKCEAGKVMEMVKRQPPVDVENEEE
ncbi:MAG: ATP-binding cassette domain-containing protein [Bacteroidales bacterium]|nr:ATP-binding cassette domain-containing protein [Bacteroidales bacterium]